jgi:ABC-type Fe3+ transport system permease subunit
MSEASINRVNIKEEDIPHSKTVLILGIVSIPSCFCFGIVGVIIAFFTFYLHKKAILSYTSNSEKYRKTSYNNLKTGKICATIGLILGLMYLLFVALLKISGFLSTYSDFSFF